MKDLDNNVNEVGANIFLIDGLEVKQVQITLIKEEESDEPRYYHHVFFGEGKINKSEWKNLKELAKKQEQLNS